MASRWASGCGVVPVLLDAYPGVHFFAGLQSHEHAAFVAAHKWTYAARRARAVYGPIPRIGRTRCCGEDMDAMIALVLTAVGSSDGNYNLVYLALVETDLVGHVTARSL